MSPEAHFACMPISIEYFCDECGNPLVATPAKISVVGADKRQGKVRHECVNPDCKAEYFFPFELPFIQHGKVAPIVPRKLYISQSDENDGSN